MKYRICKLTDANRKIWYEIQKKKWWGWKNIKTYHSIGLGRGYYKILSFFTFEEAKEWLDREIANIKWIKKAKQQKVLECIEYE